MQIFEQMIVKMNNSLRHPTRMKTLNIFVLRESKYK